MITRRVLTPAVRASAGVALLALLAVGVTAKRAATLDPLPTLGSSGAVRGGAVATRATLAPVALEAAIDADPFQPDRKRPPQRYRLPYEAAPASDTPAPAAEQPLRLVGTVVSPDGAFAMCQLGGEPPRIVRVGERVGDWTLRRIDQGRATLESSRGQKLVITVPKPGS